MNPIYLALDIENREEALKVVERLASRVGGFKIGKQMFTRYGPDFVREIIRQGGKVFLDLKYHDIPNTVGQAVREATRLGVSVINVHASGGRKMMEVAKAFRDEASVEFKVPKPLLIAVTILTSMSEEGLKEDWGLPVKLEEQVYHFAELAHMSGLDGVVCSPKEIKEIRKRCGDEFFIITPGIRPIWAQANDQKRTKTPSEAIKEGASALVIGRPILKAENQLDALERILSELERGA